MISELEIRKIDAGYYGVEPINDTAAHVGLYGALTILTACTVTAIKSDISSSNLAALVLPAGAFIRIPRMTSIQFSAGTAIAHRAPTNLIP